MLSSGSVSVVESTKNVTYAGDGKFTGICVPKIIDREHGLTKLLRKQKGAIFCPTGLLFFVSDEHPPVYN